MLLETISEVDPLLRFTSEEVRRLADYTKSSYFKHLRLYDFVLNSKSQINEVKRLTLHVTPPAIAASLSDALLLGQEEALTYEDDVEVVKVEVVGRKEAVKEENRKREEMEARKAQGIKDEEEEDADMKGINDDKLKKAKVDKETKIIINNQMNNFEGNIAKTMEERARQLDEKVNQGGAGAKKGKYYKELNYK